MQLWYIYKEDVNDARVKICCDTTQYPALKFDGSDSKPHVVQDLRKHHHTRLDPKLGYGMCAILQVPCDYFTCTTMLKMTW